MTAAGRSTCLHQGHYGLAHLEALPGKQIDVLLRDPRHQGGTVLAVANRIFLDLEPPAAASPGIILLGVLEVDIDLPVSGRLHLLVLIDRHPAKGHCDARRIDLGGRAAHGGLVSTDAALTEVVGDEDGALGSLGERPQLLEQRILIVAAGLVQPGAGFH